METKIVTVGLDAVSYDIYIGSGLLFRAADFMPAEIAGNSVYIVADENVRNYAESIRGVVLQDGAAKAEILFLEGGEKTKSFEQTEKIIDWMLAGGIARDSLVFAVGGGVIGDIAGFCASIVMRGVRYIQVPTTLLAQVDSSVGGKTGINTSHGKNLVGSFYQPGAVIADIETLRTLPKRELLAGYAEIAKYGLIGDAGFFSWLEQNGPAVCNLEDAALAHAIETSVRAKAAVVRSDEREKGVRALLNLGHTFGHALETAAKYDGRLLHGEAVAIGMVMAFDLSARMGICKREDYERVEQHLMNIGLPTHASYIEPGLQAGVDELIEIMGHDKKASRGKMKFVLARGIGEAFVTSDVSESLVREVIGDSLGRDGSGAKGRWKSAFSSHS
ncbi:MAG: 3-dehydroquinate synthase [Alphaproteobacteria bacterium]